MNLDDQYEFKIAKYEMLKLRIYKEESEIEMLIGVLYDLECGSNDFYDIRDIKKEIKSKISKKKKTEEDYEELRRLLLKPF